MMDDDDEFLETGEFECELAIECLLGLGGGELEMLLTVLGLAAVVVAVAVVIVCEAAQATCAAIKWWRGK